jgi:hypothetical protein
MEVGGEPLVMGAEVPVHVAQGDGLCSVGWFEEEVNLLSMSGFELHIVQTVV